MRSALVRVVPRYMFSKSNRHRGRTVRIMAGLAISTALMLTILSVMDFMQDTRFDSVKAVRSFPVTADVETEEEALDLVAWAEGRAPAFAYKEGEALVAYSEGEADGVLVRYIDSSYSGGARFAGPLPDGSASLPYRIWAGQPSRTIKVTTLGEGRAARIAPTTTEAVVTSYFSTPLSDFDTSTIFMPLSSAPAGLAWTVVFLVEGGEEAEAAFASELESNGCDATLWSERESSLYGAMRLEKVMMSVLLLSLYLIVFVQIIQSANMLARSKRRECAALSLMGAGRGELALLFASLGILLAALSVALGAVLALGILELIPVLLPGAAAVFGVGELVFTVDWGFASAALVAMCVLSGAAYALVFDRNLRERRTLEVLNAV